MILIKTNSNFKSINQKIYNKYTNRSFLAKILAGSQFENFVIHGYYTRKLIDENGDFFNILTLRIRVGNVTHAIFISPMIPFLHCYFDDVVSFDFTTPVSESSRYYMIKVLHKCHHCYSQVCQRFTNCSFFAETTQS